MLKISHKCVKPVMQHLQEHIVSVKLYVKFTTFHFAIFDLICDDCILLLKTIKNLVYIYYIQ